MVGIKANIILFLNNPSIKNNKKLCTVFILNNSSNKNTIEMILFFQNMYFMYIKLLNFFRDYNNFNT